MIDASLVPWAALAVMRLATPLAVVLLAAAAWAQTPTPEPTPPPRATPVPTETAPTGVRENDDAISILVSAASAPDDYGQDRDRGTVRYNPSWRNYSFHRVLLPATRPLSISECNFSQALASTVVFWYVRDGGLDLATGVSALRVMPNAHAVTAADVGCRVRVRPSAGWTRGVYAIAGQNGSTWLLDRAPAAASTRVGDWEEICPLRSFDGITFERCNLTNAWLPARASRPTLVECNISQGDLP